MATICENGGFIDMPPVLITVPPTATGTECYNFAYTPIDPETIPPPPLGSPLIAPFSLAIFSGVNPAIGITFNPPLEICSSYTDDDVAQVGDDPNNLALAYYDEIEGKWLPLDNPTVDPVNKTVCGTLSHLTMIALTARLTPAGVPVTGGESPTQEFLPPVWMLLLGTLLLLGLYARKKFGRAE